MLTEKWNMGLSQDITQHADWVNTQRAYELYTAVSVSGRGKIKELSSISTLSVFLRSLSLGVRNSSFLLICVSNIRI